MEKKTELNVLIDFLLRPFLVPSSTKTSWICVKNYTCSPNYTQDCDSLHIIQKGWS